MFLSFHRLWLKLWTSHKCGTISATRGKRQGQFGCWRLTLAAATCTLSFDISSRPTTSFDDDHLDKNLSDCDLCMTTSSKS